MSIYSLTVTIERFIYYRKARNQSVAFARQVTGFLKSDKLQDAIDASKKFPHSHVARVLSAGLYEFHHDVQSGGAGVTGHDLIEAATRAVERATLLTTADMKKGLSGLATIATTAPFIGLFGTVIGIINAFRGMALAGSGGIGAVSAGIAEALVTTAFGLVVAIPAVWMFNYFTNKIERLQIEMSNSASELVDFFMKRRGAQASAKLVRVGAPHGKGGGGRPRSAERHQRHSPRRRLSGASDHLHGRHARCSRRASTSSCPRRQTRTRCRRTRSELISVAVRDAVQYFIDDPKPTSKATPNASTSSTAQPGLGRHQGGQAPEVRRRPEVIQMIKERASGRGRHRGKETEACGLPGENKAMAMSWRRRRASERHQHHARWSTWCWCC